MSIQTSYDRTLPAAFRGLLADLSPHYVRSFKNAVGTHVVTVTIDTVGNDTLYTIALNGVLVSYTSDGTALEAEVNAGLLAALAASAYATAIATAEQGATTETIVITAVDANSVFDVAVSAELSAAVTTQGGEEIGFGLFVKDNGSSNGKLMANLSDAADVVAGMTVHTHSHTVKTYTIPHTYATSGGNDNTGIQPGEMASVARRGVIWALAEEAMAVGDDVYARHTKSGSNLILGAVRNDSDTNTALAVSGATVLDYNSSLGLVLLDLNL